VTANNAVGSAFDASLGAGEGWLDAPPAAGEGWFDAAPGAGPEPRRDVALELGLAEAREAHADTLDSLVMEARDRLANLGFFAGAGVVWILVALVLTSRDPRVDTAAGFVGALVIGLAVGLTLIPLFWLAIFARHRRIAYRGDWTRAVRRGGWAAVVTTVFVILRLQGAFVPALALFILALVVLAEAVLSVER
jgi:hypothetical protein